MIHARYHIFLVLALSLFASACSKEKVPAGVSGSITLAFSTGELQTRAGGSGDGSVIDGGGISVNNSGEPDLVVAIANRFGNIVAWYPKDYGAVGETIDYTAEKLTPLTAAQREKLERNLKRKEEPIASSWWPTRLD